MLKLPPGFFFLLLFSKMQEEREKLKGRLLDFLKNIVLKILRV